MQYEIVIGLEVHVELQTQSKIFCSCINQFEGRQNSHVCEGCAGFPGVLPVPNKKVFEIATRAGLALNCKINNISKFERKHYFYADLPDAYQITQNELPLCAGGFVEIETEQNNEKSTHKIRLNHIHVEEDAGKLVHDDFLGGSGVDLNRSAVPLIEIVTEPDFRNSEQVRVFLEKIKSTMQYLGVSDCKMQEGSMRCDVNVSVRKFGEEQYGVRTEMKNMSSFSNVVKAIAYESDRHIQCIENQEKIKRETRGWNEQKNQTYSLRSKEEANDYRYLPEPNIPPIYISQQEVETLRNTQPMLAPQMREFFKTQYNLSDYDCQVLTQSKYIATFFKQTVELGAQPKKVSNYIMMDVLRLLKEHSMEASEIKILPQQLFEIIELVEQNKINQTTAKMVLEEIFGDPKGKQPTKIVEQRGLLQNNDGEEIREIVKEIIVKNLDAVEKYNNGNERALASIVGQTMKAAKGKANPQLVNTLILEEIKNLL